jgi:hypothetical protein
MKRNLLTDENSLLCLTFYLWDHSASEWQTRETLFLPVDSCQTLLKPSQLFEGNK